MHRMSSSLLFKVFFLKAVLPPRKGFSCNAVFPLCLPLKTVLTCCKTMYQMLFSITCDGKKKSVSRIHFFSYLEY